MTGHSRFRCPECGGTKRRWTTVRGRFCSVCVECYPARSRRQPPAPTVEAPLAAPVLPPAADPLDLLDAWAAERPGVRDSWITRRERREE